MHIFRTIATSIREGLSTQELWLAEDNGLIACWERGRQMALDEPEVAEAAMADELVPLPWKGGVGTTTKNKHKYGTLRYLAMWQGLRKEDLDIDTAEERQLFCRRFETMVTFTQDKTKY
ncbi:hypothetical protein [Paralcaligenes ginsengisoli]